MEGADFAGCSLKVFDSGLGRSGRRVVVVDRTTAAVFDGRSCSTRLATGCIDGLDKAAAFAAAAAVVAAVDSRHFVGMIVETLENIVGLGLAVAWA